MTDKKPKLTGDTVCATCWIRGQGHEIGMCHCGRGDFIDKGLLDYIILISKQQGYEQGKLDLLPKIEAIEAIIEKTHDIGQVAVELYRLKSQISKEGEKR